MNIILTLLLSLSFVQSAIAADRAVLQNGQGIEVGTSANPLQVSVSGGISSAGGWTDDGTAVRLTTTSDNVAIGTTTPTAKLTVIGTTNANGNVGIKYTAGDPGVALYVFGSEGTGNGNGIAINNSITTALGLGVINIRCKNSNSCGGSIYGAGDVIGVGVPGLNFQTDIAGGNFAFGTGANGGNIGIGTGTIPNKLSVLGGASFGSYATTTAPDGGILVSGNVGIGTVNPQAFLSIASLVSPAIPIIDMRRSSVNGRAQIQIDNQVAGSSADFILKSTLDTPGSASAGFLFRTLNAGSSRDSVAINGAGNVGISTLNPAQRVEIGGNASKIRMYDSGGVGWNCGPAVTTGVFTCT